MKISNMKISKLFLVSAVLAVIVIFVICLSALTSATEYELNFTGPPKSVPIPTPNLIVRTMKYDPYPVSAGDAFDIWIKVENVGEADANNVKFELLNEYPFTSVDAFNNYYGTIPGKISAAQNQRPDEAKSLDNQVVLKYRVKVADSAPEGTSILKLALPAYGTNGTRGTGQTFDLPIVIKKTKTDFDIVPQEVTVRRATFAITNTGQKMGSAVTVSVKDQSMVDGETTTIIGNMDPGEFTAVSFNLLPNKTADSVKFEITYTDIAGIRNIIEKTIPVKIDTYPPVQPNTSEGAGLIGAVQRYAGWLLLLAGLVTGIVLGATTMRRPKKKKSADN